MGAARVDQMPYCSKDFFLPFCADINLTEDFYGGAGKFFFLFFHAILKRVARCSVLEHLGKGSCAVRSLAVFYSKKVGWRLAAKLTWVACCNVYSRPACCKCFLF